MLLVPGERYVYTVDTYNHRVKVTTDAGVYMGQWGSWGVGNYNFQFPTDLCIDSNGNVYVCDSDNNRIMVYDYEGLYLRRWGSFSEVDVGKFNNPMGISADELNFIYVSDSNNNRIQKFTSAGVFVTTWGSSGLGNSQFNIPEGSGIRVP